VAKRADVAKLAGVSESTVSYAISGVRPISEKTRKRVLDAIQELDYHPHFAAGSLAGGRSKSIALLFPAGESGLSPSASEYIVGAANGARDHGYYLVLWPSQDSHIKQMRALKSAGWIAGALLMEIALEDKRVNFLMKNKVPISLIGRPLKDEKLDYVDQDFDAVAQMTLDYLQDLNHKYIALIDLNSKQQTDIGVAIRSTNSLKQAAASRDLNLIEVWIENSGTAGKDALDLILKEYPEVTAIVGLNDVATMGLFNATHEMDIKIPNDISIISLSTPSEYAKMTWPPLTTVAMPAYEMGYQSAELLIARLEGSQEPAQHKLWVGNIEVRGSTGPATKKKTRPKKSLLA